jgi:flavin reductase (DIM6/NTAB) family NADH-FMN oxidoreductase RutF
MHKTACEDIGKFYQHYPRTPVIVTASAGGRDNAMPAAWHTAVSKKPPLYCAVISAGHYTYKLVKESGEFGLNFLPATRSELVAALGGSKGSQTDKFADYCLKKDPSLKTCAPVLADAYAAFECKLVEDLDFYDHHMIMGEIVAVHYCREAFLEDGSLDLSRIAPALYMGSEKYLDLASGKETKLDRSACADKLKA